MEELSEIDKKLSELYPINEETEKALSAISYEITDENIYCINIGPYTSKRFEEIIIKSDIGEFHKGLFYEYGINSYEKDLNKAYNIYLEAANKNKDYLSMYKMYIIHLKQYEKFNINKDKILELYYLMKCITYLPEIYLSCSNNKIYNFVSVLNCFLLHIIKEDENKNKFYQFFELLEKSNKYNFIKKEEIDLIKITLSLRFNLKRDKTEDFFNELEKLSSTNIDAKYIKTCLLIYELFSFNFVEGNKIGEIENTIKQNFEYLYENKYYKSFDTIFRYNQIEKYSNEKLLNILEDGYKNYNIFCYRFYFDFCAGLIDIENFDKTKHNLLDILEIIIDADILGQSHCSYRIYNFIYIVTRKLKFEIESIILKFGKLINENALFIEKINYDTLSQVRYNFKEDLLDDYKRAYGYLILKDKFTSVKKYINFSHFKDYYINSSIFFQKARSAIILYKIVKKILKNNNNSFDPLDLNDLHKNCFNSLFDFIKGGKSFSLDYYYLAKFFKEAIGTEKDISKAFFLFNQINNLDYRLNETFGSRYCKIKAKKELKDEAYKEIYNKINGLKQEQCNICYEKKEDTVFLPCYHKLCYDCAKVIVNCLDYVICKCPFCRQETISFIKINNQ